MRNTKIICTLGPASTDIAVLTQLIQNGMNIARINFSHGTQEGHRNTIQTVKKLRDELQMPIGLLLDTKGAEIRTGDTEKPIELKAGDRVLFSFQDKSSPDMPVIRVNYDQFSHDVRGAECILLDNGAVRLRIETITDNGDVIAKTEDDGVIKSRRHVNLPGADISLPSMTEKDWSDLQLGIEEEMDFVALSFIRTAEEVSEVRAFLQKQGSSMRIITKIETRQSVADIDRIIDASDGIMVARGDLGAEMPFERIPAVQDMIVSKCIQKAKPVIVATHMLESMIENPMPTRAEVTDIAHAAVTRADCTMLSGETAAGEYPLQSLDAMDRILKETESTQSAKEWNNISCPLGDGSALASAAVSMALRTSADAIVVLTKSGATARAVSNLRSNLPIIACAETADIMRSLTICHGIEPLTIPFKKDPEETIEQAFTAITQASLLQKGSKVVMIADVNAHGRNVHTVHVREI